MALSRLASVMPLEAPFTRVFVATILLTPRATAFLESWISHLLSWPQALPVPTSSHPKRLSFWLVLIFTVFLVSDSSNCYPSFWFRLPLASFLLYPPSWLFLLSPCLSCRVPR